MKWFFFIPLLFLFSEAMAFDYPYTIRSPEGLLMGDAFTAVNDDSFTLFYNPASLGRHKNDFTLNPFNPQFSGPNILDDRDRFENFPTEPVPASRLLMDYPVHASAGIAPGFKLFNIGVSFFASESFDVLLRNRAHPMLDLDIHSDKGLILGVGIPMGTSRISKKSKSGSQTSIGIAAKYIERTGIRDTLALAGPTVVDSLGQDELKDLLKSLGQVKGIGYGFDAGIEHLSRNGNSQFIIGLSALDITGTTFKEQETPEELQVSDIRDQVNLGIAAGQDFKLFHYILSADVRGLNEEMDFGKRLRFGVQLGIPGIKLLAGVNSGYYSYGATLDLAILKVTGGFYDLELGSKYKQTKSKRFIVYVSLFDFSFDA
ncbi:MAG: hypothetical protein ACLGHN_08405 [Bacteriovoracia bacterium]